MVSTLHKAVIALLPDHKDKVYAVFNNVEFYVVTDESLVGIGCDDILVPKEIIFNNLGGNGTHLVAEFDTIDDIMDFYNSKEWQNIQI